VQLAKIKALIDLQRLLAEAEAERSRTETERIRLEPQRLLAEAEADRSRAENERIRLEHQRRLAEAEADRSRAETERIRAETHKNVEDISYIGECHKIWLDKLQLFEKSISIPHACVSMLLVIFDFSRIKLNRVMVSLISFYAQLLWLIAEFFSLSFSLIALFSFYAGMRSQMPDLSWLISCFSSSLEFSPYSFSSHRKIKSV
jgi:hypothetical protein